ncbi:hypothetical protein FGG08_005177 [Glutinoglossum americanum]|uniref:Signal recognition particle receptor subunit alpha homolog n=1 Tax=Glutinoglossum americanum TaxID=1670608 RepID=A0A9P8I5Y3_9PEZI|nr:hypothetical protein FGG08_005177 [Glutinoglossum americanum]
MLDSFEILSTSGVVLWSKAYAPVNSNVINSLITDVFIEERIIPTVSGEAARNPQYKKDQYTLKWKSVKDLGLIFIAVYQSLLHLSWIDELLDKVKDLFVELYGSQLKKPNTSVVECHFGDYFDTIVRDLETASGGLPERYVATVAKSVPPNPALSLDEPPPLPGILRAQPKIAEKDSRSADQTPNSTPQTSRPASPAINHLISAPKGAPGGRTSRRARKAANAPNHASSGEENSLSRKPKGANKSTGKKMRRWDADGLADEDDGDQVLDYSTIANTDEETDDGARPGAMEQVRQEDWGTKTGRGEFVLKDLDDEVNSILSSVDAKKKTSGPTSGGVVGSSIGVISGLFRNVVGGKLLTHEDLEKPMRGMEEHLLNKNVAREAAIRLCEGVERSLVGVKTGSFQTIDATIRAAMESSLRKILTPTSSLDLLREIQSVTSPSLASMQSRRPYVISIVGVNGVGKSTNLSKIAFFLLQNKYRVLIAACDTFRSGAVEQLRVHARNLKELGEREGGFVELYEKGYGKDAANTAKDAVSYATQASFDVVLIDTAGRRHNDQRLMSSLEKFAKFAQPDKILMVGEALVGTDSVQQARNFNAAFGAGRHLDGFIISKCDTVGEMIGTLVSMVHATGIPVVFLGTGQHYSDLRTLNIGWAVKLLMS